MHLNPKITGVPIVAVLFYTCERKYELHNYVFVEPSHYCGINSLVFHATCAMLFANVFGNHVIEWKQQTETTTNY